MGTLKVAFEYADKEGKGELSRDQYKIAMTVLFGYCPDKLEMKQPFWCASKNSVTYEEFVNCVRRKGFPRNTVIDAKTLLVLLDKNFKGHVDIQDFYSASKETDLKVCRSIWRKVFKEMDQRNKGFLDLDDLILVMKEQRP